MGLVLTRCERFHIITSGFRTHVQALGPAARMTISAVGLCSSMKLHAFLVIVFLALPLPLASFGIPPSFLFPVVLGASAPPGTAEFRTAVVPARSTQSAAPAAGSADWIARQVDQRDTGRDPRLTMQMRLFDRQGRARERTLGVNGLRGHRGDTISDSPSATSSRCR
jgi:hypothetical protein